MNHRLAFLVVAVLALGSPVQAEINSSTTEAYNAAVQGSDAETLVATATALMNEAIASPNEDQSTVLAYEAAWALCRNGKCEQALPGAKFVVTRPETGEHPSLADRELLLAFAEWKTDRNRKTRKVLDETLAARVSDAPNLLTVAAFQARYIDDAEHRRTKRLPISAGEAASHFHPVRDQIGELWSHAAILASAAAFGEDHDPESLVEMAKVAGELNLIRHVTDDEPAWMEKRHLEATAWQYAMDAYFRSEEEGEEERELVDQILDDAITDENHEHPPGTGPHRENGPPSCKGGFTSMPTPTYPDNAAWDGYVGAVIVLFDVDASGANNIRIGASVPTDTFDEASLSSVRKLKWKWDDAPADAEPCVKSRTGMQWPFYYVLE